MATKGPMAGGRKLPGDEGVWFFISADLVLFAMFFGSFCYQRSLAPAAYNVSQRLLEPWIATINTGLLLTSSWLVARAVATCRAGRPVMSMRLISAAVAMGMGFVIIKAFEYRHEILMGADLNSEFFMFYFIVTGIHLLHVIGGIGVLIVLRTRLATGGASDISTTLVESGASFWHMVDLLWLVIFPLFYLLR